eukprot:11118637-Heterocapsa_arctica.AAC.1
MSPLLITDPCGSRGEAFVRLPLRSVSPGPAPLTRTAARVHPGRPRAALLPWSLRVSMGRMPRGSWPCTNHFAPVYLTGSTNHT